MKSITASFAVLGELYRKLLPGIQWRNIYHSRTVEIAVEIKLSVKVRIEDQQEAVRERMNEVQSSHRP